MGAILRPFSVGPVEITGRSSATTLELLAAIPVSSSKRNVLARLSAERCSRLARYAISSNRAASSRDVASDKGVDMLLIDERHTPSRTQTIPITCPLYTTSKMWVDFETGM